MIVRLVLVLVRGVVRRFSKLFFTYGCEVPINRYDESTVYTITLVVPGCSAHGVVLRLYDYDYCRANTARRLVDTKLAYAATIIVNIYKNVFFFFF